MLRRGLVTMPVVWIRLMGCKMSLEDMVGKPKCDDKILWIPTKTQCLIHRVQAFFTSVTLS